MRKNGDYIALDSSSNELSSKPLYLDDNMNWEITIPFLNKNVRTHLERKNPKFRVG